MNWIEIFKTGTHTDMSGKTRNWTEGDLDTIVAKYKPNDRESPLVLGHPTAAAPAMGWVESLKREGQKLMMLPKQVEPTFAEWVKEGRYKKKSISLYPDLTLRHVGYLGAMQPAVSGLADGSFSERAGDVSGVISMEFSDAWTNSAIGRLFQGIRDYLIGKEGKDKADSIINQWDIDTIKQAQDDEVATPAPMYSEGTAVVPGAAAIETPPATPVTPVIPAAPTTPAAPASTFSESEAEKDATIATLRLQLEASAKEKRDTEFKSFCSGLIKQGKLLRAQEPLAFAMMDVLEGVGEYEFAEGKKAPLGVFKDFLATLPVQISFAEIAVDGSEASNGLDANKLAEQASSYMEEQAAKGIIITSADAVKHVKTKGVSK